MCFQPNKTSTPIYYYITIYITYTRIGKKTTTSKGNNYVKTYRITIPRNYASGHVMTKFLWKFGHNSLRNVAGVEYKRNLSL
jgi:hypothetical protein